MYVYINICIYLKYVVSKSMFIQKLDYARIPEASVVIVNVFAFN